MERLIKCAADNNRINGACAYFRTFFRILFISALVFSLCSCSLRKLMVREVAGSVETGLSVLEQDDDTEMLEKALPANIKLLEAFLANDPENRRLLVLLARLYASYTFAFIEGKIEAAALSAEPDSTVAAAGETLRKSANRYYLKGTEYALRAIQTRRMDCGLHLKKVRTVDQCFKEMTNDDVPALFWYGFNLGSFVNLNRDSVKAISKAHIAEKAMKKIIDLEPDYYHSGAHLFLLAYYASRPPMMGGNPAAALAHYRKVKEMQGEGFLLADLYYARYYLYQQQEREAYEKALTGILNHSKSHKAFGLLNKVAKTRAKVILEAADRLFE